MVEQEAQPRILADYARPTMDGTRSSIVRPLMAANTFELKPTFVQMVRQSCSFHGLPDDDPSTHLGNFLEVGDMFMLLGVTSDAIRLRVFPFSLKARAKEWLQSLVKASVTTWDLLAK